MISSFSEIRTRQIFLQFMYVAEMQNRSGTVQMMLSETEMAKKEKKYSWKGVFDLWKLN